MSRYVYTTIRPERMLTVDDAEYADLAAQQLLLAEVDPDTGAVLSGALYVPPVPVDAAETLADDQPAPAADSRPTRSGG